MDPDPEHWFRQRPRMQKKDWAGRHEPDEEWDGGEKKEKGGERQVARPHHVQRLPVRAQRENPSLYLSL